MRDCRSVYKLYPQIPGTVSPEFTKLRRRRNVPPAPEAVSDEIWVLTWLDRTQRDVLAVRPRDDPRNPDTGVFSTRSQDRPNPIGLHRIASYPSTVCASASVISRRSERPSSTSSQSSLAAAEPDAPSHAQSQLSRAGRSTSVVHPD
jgi:hypothetical protein